MANIVYLGGRGVVKVQMTGIVCLEHCDEEHKAEAGLNEKSVVFY